MLHTYTSWTLQTFSCVISVFHYPLVPHAVFCLNVASGFKHRAVIGGRFAKGRDCSLCKGSCILASEFPPELNECEVSLCR